MKIIHIIFLLLLGQTTYLFTGDQAWGMALYVRDMQVSIISAMLYYLINSKHFKQRTLILLFTLYCCIDAQLNLIYQISGYNTYSQLFYLCLALFTVTFIYNYKKQYNIKSDTIKNDNIYICLWRPRTARALFFSLIGLPIGGVSIYSRGYWWGFRWSKKGYVKEKIDKKTISKSFVVFDTGKSPIRDIVLTLDSFIGSSPGIFRHRCIKTIIPALKMLGEKYTPSNIFELIPSVYSRKLLNG